MTPKQRRILFIAGGVGAAVLVAILITLWVLVWVPPSQQDFKEARTTIKTIDESYEKIDKADGKYYRTVRYGLGGSKTRETVLTESIAVKKKYLEVMNSHKAALRAFEESRAYKDAEVATAYDKFVAKDKVFIANSEGYVYPLFAFMSSFDTCEDVFKLTKTGSVEAIATQHKEASKDCLPDLDEMAKSKPGPIATYGKKFGDIIRERQAIFDKTADGKMSLEDSSKKIKEITARYGRLDPLGEVNKNAKALNFANELTALKKVLDRKVAQ